MTPSPAPRLERAGLAPTATPPGLRLAVLVHLAPRKRGSFEDWILAMIREASRRNHQLDVYGAEPIAPSVRADLEGAGSRWCSIDWLRAHPLAGIRMLRQYHVLHFNMFATRHPITLMGYAAWPARLVFVDHTSEDPPRPNRFTQIKTRALDFLTSPRIARMVGVSDFVRHRARLDMHLPTERATTIYNGVDLARFGPNRDGRNRQGFQVGCVANLIPAKGVETLLRALACLNLPRWRLMVVGDGPDQGRLSGVASELGISGQVAFLGLRNDVPELLRQCHVFVHPATWPEAFGLTITEAMASGCPVIASRVGAVPELIQDGMSGILVPPGDVRALSSALRILYHDPRLAANLAATARRRVEERFGLDRCVREHLDLMEELAGAEPRQPRLRVYPRARASLVPPDRIGRRRRRRTG